MSRLFYLFLLPIFFWAPLSARGKTNVNQALEEITIAMHDLRHAYNSQQMDLQLLEEKVATLSALEEELRKVESRHTQIEKDLQALRSHANESSQSFVQFKGAIKSLENQMLEQKKKLSEVVKLKGTLTSLSAAISKQGSTHTIHIVKSGDSLEKIARKYNTSIKALKAINGLNSHKILIGQELKIPEN